MSTENCSYHYNSRMFYSLGLHYCIILLLLHPLLWFRNHDITNPYLHICIYRPTYMYIYAYIYTYVLKYVISAYHSNELSNINIFHEC
jgi:hypothetical protein